MQNSVRGLKFISQLLWKRSHDESYNCPCVPHVHATSVCIFSSGPQYCLCTYSSPQFLLVCLSLRLMPHIHLIILISFFSSLNRALPLWSMSHILASSNFYMYTFHLSSSSGLSYVPNTVGLTVDGPVTPYFTRCWTSRE